MKKDSGVTLISLVITIVIIGIIAGIGVYSSVQSIDFVGQNKMETQLRMIMEKVKIIRRERSIGIDTYDNAGISYDDLKNSTNSIDVANTARANKAFTEAGVDVADRATYRFFTPEHLIGLGLNEFDIDVLINYDLEHIIYVE